MHTIPVKWRVKSATPPWLRRARTATPSTIGRAAVVVAKLQHTIHMPSLHTVVQTLQPGLCDSPIYTSHGISLHLGAPAPTLCLDVPGTKRFHRVPGGLNIVPAGAPSRWLLEGPVQAMYLRIPSHVFARVAEDMGLTASAVRLEIQRQVHDARISHIAQALHLERAEGMPNGTFLADSLEAALCARLLSAYSTRPPLSRRVNRAFTPAGVERLVAYIDEHLADPGLTLAHLAAVAGTSVSYLKEAFRRSTGRPLHRYVVEQRVERAVAMLMAGGEISDVAAAVGFSHASHLARWTRRLLRTAPQDIRSAGRTRRP
jgi:AraC family transcriptional regulator